MPSQTSHQNKTAEHKAKKTLQYPAVQLKVQFWNLEFPVLGFYKAPPFTTFTQYPGTRALIVLSYIASQETVGR